MAATVAASRLKKELAKLRREPPSGDIVAEPKENDVLTWFYAVKGPPGTPYQGGTYVGKISFPKEYPMKPPGIQMLTPNGRFATNTRLCLSMSDFHPESWNPMWSVSSILQGVQSFMASEELTTGGIRASDAERRRLAKESLEYNRRQFGDLFDGDIVKAFEDAEKAAAASEAKRTATASSASSKGRICRRKGGASTNSRNESGGAGGSGAVDSDSEEETAPTPTPDLLKEELSPEEQEKRKKKNAKKRARQKAKKAASAAATSNATGEDNDYC